MISAPEARAYSMAFLTMALSPKLPIEMLINWLPASTAATMPLASRKLSDWPRSFAMRTEMMSESGATPGVNVPCPLIMEATAVPWPFCSAGSAGGPTRSYEVILFLNAAFETTPVSSTAMRTPFPQVELSWVMPSQSNRPAPRATAPSCALPSLLVGTSTGKIIELSSSPSSRDARSS